MSLWEIEPLTATFLLCPPAGLEMSRSKRPRGMPGKVTFYEAHLNVFYIKFEMMIRDSLSYDGVS